MADHTSHSQNYAKAIQSFFGSPKLRDFTAKCLSGAEALRSPTSILETIPLLLPLPSFGIPKISSEKRSPWDEKMDSKGIGLAALKDEGIEHNSEKPNNANLLLGTQLKVKIPPLSSSPFTFYPFESDQASDDAGFGITTQNSDVSPNGSQSSRIYTQDSSGVVCTGVVSLSEMELSEDYTGEKAFCSSECRYQEMILDGAENSEFDTYPRS
ncbi:protein MARD1-like [Senna tora]|uniref:Protein MARD1-like n=1 Tax=Senna tora TaxID=362788 RepID=A0A834TA37_9FABA|nr:protein MARD1-like [Senna tora]